MRERGIYSDMSPFHHGRTEPRTEPPRLLSRPFALVKQMMTGLETAFRCSAIYDELSALDDNALRQRGLARDEIPRVAAVSAGLLLPKPRTAEAVRAPRAPQNRNLARTAA